MSGVDPKARCRQRSAGLPWRLCFCGCIVLSDGPLEHISAWIQHVANCQRKMMQPVEIEAVAGLLAVAQLPAPWENQKHSACGPQAGRRDRSPAESRRLGHAHRHTEAQRAALRLLFEHNPYPSTLRKCELAEEIGLTLRQVNAWFNHARQCANKNPPAI